MRKIKTEDSLDKHQSALLSKYFMEDNEPIWEEAQEDVERENKLAIDWPIY